MTILGLNWCAALATIIANLVLGFLWYGPVFGKMWVKLVGKKKDDLPQKFTMYVIPILATLLSTIVLSTIMHATRLSGVISALSLSGLVLSPSPHTQTISSKAVRSNYGSLIMAVI